MKYLMILSLLLVGCATTHPGTKGAFLNGEKDLNIAISAISVDYEKNSAFELFEITIENTGNDWVRINNTKLLVGSDVSVVVGKDLQSWAEATELQLKKDQYNKEVAIAATQGVGAAAVIAGTASNKSTITDIGTLAVLGGAAWATVDTISAARRNAIGVKQVPESHLYESFSVPAKLFNRKWVLISRPPGRYINKLVMEFETVEGDKSVYAIDL